MVVVGAISNNWMSSAGSPWLDKAQPRSASTNDQEKEVAIDTESTDNNRIHKIAQDPCVRIAGATGKFGNWISAMAWVDLKR